MFTFLTASWWKMHSHVVEFLSVVSARFNVRPTLSIIVRRCLKSLKVKSESYILFKHSRFRKWNAFTVQQTLGITKKKKIWVISQNLHMFVLRWCSEMTICETWSFSCLVRDWKSPPQRRNVANIFGKEVDLHYSLPLMRQERVTNP